MSVRTCDHLKEDGVFCNSPALNGRNYRYFHLNLNLRGRRLNMARARALAADHPLDLPFPEDMHSVQVTLFEVVNALANKRIDHKAAGLVLYAMQQASINLNNKHASQSMCQSVKPDAPMLALEFRDFEQQYHLPKRIDLEADPETALQDAGVLPDDAARNCLLGASRIVRRGQRYSEFYLSNALARNRQWLTFAHRQLCDHIPRPEKRKEKEEASPPPRGARPVAQGTLESRRPGRTLPRLHQRWSRVDEMPTLAGHGMPPDHAFSAHNSLRLNILPATPASSIFCRDFRLSPPMLSIFYGHRGEGEGVLLTTAKRKRVFFFGFPDSTSSSTSDQNIWYFASSRLRK